MNGYFQLEVRSKGIYMIMVPPRNGGTHCTMADVIKYLEHHNITGYNAVELKKLVEHGKPGAMFLNSMWMPTLGEDVLVAISDDKMTATATFYPPFVGGKKMDRETIESALAAKGITVGIQQDAIDKFLQEREYCTPYVIALGVEPKQGTDATIEYFFDTVLCAKPQLNEDGSVDFHKLNSISHIQKGDILATLTPEKRGTPGTNVLGGPVPAKDVRKKKLSFGKNISYTDDRLSIVSDVDGHVSLINDQVFVSDTYQVLTDVDAGTGDIDYKGNIEVKGNVRSGFALKATGDIIVNGVVEGATLTADGDIVLSRGIQGMGKGLLVAKGNVVSKFVENATIRAGGNVTAEAILHSHVSAKEKVLVTGKKGFITGGKVSALHCVEAKTIGSTMGAETTISVGTDPEEREREYQCQVEMAQLRKDITRLEPVVKKMTAKLVSGEKITADMREQTKIMVTQYREYKKKHEELEKELMERLEAERMEKGANVRVNGKIYPGVKVMISDHMHVVRETIKYCRFDLVDMEVKIGAL